MSTMQRLTLIGLYNYNPNLFDLLTLPDGYDKDAFIDSLLLEHGEKCVLYANPEFMKNAIAAWGRKWAGNLERIYRALTEEYNPLHNFDRFEEYSDNEGRKYESKTNAGHKASDSPKYDDDVTNDYDVVTSSDIDKSVETKVSAFNSSAYEPSQKVVENGGKTTVANDGTIKRHIEGKTQDLSETSNSTTNDAETHNFTHNGHLYGNIGVTTSVQMLTSEVDARMKYNLYDAAGRLFANELLIGIY